MFPFQKKDFCMMLTYSSVRQLDELTSTHEDPEGNNFEESFEQFEGLWLSSWSFLILQPAPITQ